MARILHIPKNINYYLRDDDDGVPKKIGDDSSFCQWSKANAFGWTNNVCVIKWNDTSRVCAGMLVLKLPRSGSLLRESRNSLVPPWGLFIHNVPAERVVRKRKLGKRIEEGTTKVHLPG